MNQALLKAMNLREITFFVFALLGVLAAILIVSLTGQPPAPQPAGLTSASVEPVGTPEFGHPDEFARHFADIQGITSGYEPYPHGYLLREFEKARARNAKRGPRAKLNWVERGPGRVGGRTRALLVDPTDPDYNTWIVGAVGGGVWRGQRSVDSFDQDRVEWTSLTDHLPNLAVTALGGMSPNHPDVIYMGTGEGFYNIDAASGYGLFKSTDRGTTWTHLPATSVADNVHWRFVNRLAVDPDNPDVVVVATNGGIFRTTDGGMTFVEVYTNPSRRRVQDLKATPGNFDIQFATVNRTAILRSTDAGETWHESMGESDFVHAVERIELAISPSNTDVIWASAQGTRFIEGPEPARQRFYIAELFRTQDGGNSWRLVMDYAEERSGLQAVARFLDNQGWFDNAIAVHPFSPDTVYLGGVQRWKSWLSPERGTIDIPFVEITSNTASFISMVNYTGTHASGTLSAGYALIDTDDLRDLSLSDMTSVQVRFGPGLSQMAHRFTVPPNGGTVGDGGAGISYADYQYADYVRVPFEVWDTDNNRQLMVSFRDQARNGTWDLIPINTSGPGPTHSRDYVLISKYDYANTPNSSLARNGGARYGLMYFFWPTLAAETEWNPDNPPPGVLDIDFTSQIAEVREISSWENGTVHVDHHDITIVPIDQAANKFYIFNGNDGGMAYSRDGGATWNEGDASAGYNTSQFYDATKRPGFAMYLGGTQDNGTWASYDNPNITHGWRFMFAGDGFDVIWASADSLIGSSQYNNIRRSLRGGAGWHPVWNQRTMGGQFLTSLGWSPKAPDAVFTITPGGSNARSGVYRSLDFAATWSPLILADSDRWSAILNGQVTNGMVRVSIADPSIVWAGHRLSRNGITLHVSENALSGTGGDVIGGDIPTFRAVDGPTWAPGALISGLATHPVYPNTVYVTFAAPCRPKVLRTNNFKDPSQWEDLSGFRGTTDCTSSNGFPDVEAYDVLAFPDALNVLWAATDMGIMESLDHGNSWHYADNGLPAVSVWRLRLVDGEVIAATHGRGVWSLDVSEVRTSVVAAADVPDSFELMPNYPNPFNPTTTIGFRAPVASHVRITVFDVLGRSVATLTDTEYGVGVHRIDWDASHMASGQYFYRLEAGGKLVGTQSMVLIK